jgi:protein arginine kinase activator
MICGNCGKREATVHLTEIIKNIKTGYHLCETCAKNIKLNLKLRNYSDSLNEILTFLDNDKVETENKCCLNCGLTFAEFKKELKTGCPYCYHYHGDIIKSAIPNLTEAKTHIGRKPDNYINIEKNIEPHHLYKMLTDEHETENNTEDLKEKLEIAVSEERYEDAAKLRDLVRELERVR